jgi:cobalt/nickel transport system permease protein
VLWPADCCTAPAAFAGGRFDRTEGNVAGGHTHALYRHTEGPLHRAHPQVKVAATLVFVAGVVATPREAFWAFGLDATILLVVATMSRLPFGFVVRRLLTVLPFVAFAVLLPFIAPGSKVEVLGASLSRSGLWSAWNIVVKALLGAAASIVLAATTQAPDLLKGLARLRVPRVVTAVMGFMIRYLDVIIDEMRRMRVALESRGLRPARSARARAGASLVGTLFVRSYERGERVHLAMLARGYSGAMPDLERTTAPASEWAVGVLAALAAAAAAALGWVLR